MGGDGAGLGEQGPERAGQKWDWGGGGDFKVSVRVHKTRVCLLSALGFHLHL